MGWINYNEDQLKRRCEQAIEQDREREVVEEKTVSVGTGFPFRQSLGALDVALSYGIIGELEKNGMETEVWRLTISVTGLEHWW